ncbi:hypothetical protein BFG57_15550 [Bacillus solimangrovi]|uniref:Uracil-DNA glycosylase-like domain-containing protein n=2 Tax=Bacillus solimangrovi TaxID=1305675 RepID=A0A1E5LEH0_9BACI|nr:hypothetical protein BFG57_15550 [Bacillus solimangrovi]
MLFTEMMNELSEQYLVPDANMTNASIIFILESPHVQEVKHGVPVAGASGITMTKQLLGNECKQPLGLIVKAHLNEGIHNEIGKVGLMNICQIPMQRTAYQKDDIESYLPMFDIIEEIRTANHKERFKNETYNEVQTLILEHFLKRLRNVESESCILIPCGRFAQKFFRLAQKIDKDRNWKTIEEVPHPSYNSWSRERYKNVIDKVIKSYHEINQIKDIK